MANKTQKLLKSLKSRPEVKTPIATDMFLPNQSGDHGAGRMRRVPEKEIDLVNKKYVDAAIAAISIKLNEVGNPDGNKSFTMSNKLLGFRYTAPTPAGDFAGAFEIEGAGGFSGNLVHIHQHTGNPGSVRLLDLESDDADVTDLRINSAGEAITVVAGNTVVADHGTASTDQVTNTCYGTGAPPAANTTTEGTSYLKYIP